jgi:outer membrane autotransporter protein
MRKFVIATIVALAASTSAMAQTFGGVEYNYRDGWGEDKGVTQNGYTLTLGTFVAKDTAIDLKSVFRREDGTGDTTNRVETGLTQGFEIPGLVFKPYVRAAVGQQFVTGDDFSYYSVEPGVRMPLTNKLTGRVAYRYRNAFDNANQFETNTARLGLEYAINKNHSLGLGYDRIYGDSKANGVNVGYNIRF